MRIERKVGTLGDAARYHRLLNMDCYACGHHEPLVIPLLISEHGDMTLQRFMERAVCRKCGARWPRIDCRVGH